LAFIVILTVLLWRRFVLYVLWRRWPLQRYVVRFRWSLTRFRRRRFFCASS